MMGRQRSYKIPPEPKTVRTFGTKPGAKLAAFRQRVEERKKKQKSGCLASSRDGS
jgi:hypothetical protein